jgi:hypothetical protein
MKRKKKNGKNKPQKPKRPYRKKLSPEAMEAINRQKEVSFFDKCKNWTRANLIDGDIILFEDSLERITPWLDKVMYMLTHKSFRANLSMYLSHDVCGQGLLVKMKCGGKVKVTKNLKVEFKIRLSQMPNT